MKHEINTYSSEENQDSLLNPLNFIDWTDVGIDLVTAISLGILGSYGFCKIFFPQSIVAINNLIKQLIH